MLNLLLTLKYHISLHFSRNVWSAELFTGWFYHRSSPLSSLFSVHCTVFVCWFLWQQSAGAKITQIVGKLGPIIILWWWRVVLWSHHSLWSTVVCGVAWCVVVWCVTPATAGSVLRTEAVVECSGVWCTWWSWLSLCHTGTVSDDIETRTHHWPQYSNRSVSHSNVTQGWYWNNIR